MLFNNLVSQSGGGTVTTQQIDVQDNIRSFTFPLKQGHTTNYILELYNHHTSILNPPLKINGGYHLIVSDGKALFNNGGMFSYAIGTDTITITANNGTLFVIDYGT